MTDSIVPEDVLAVLQEQTDPDEAPVTTAPRIAEELPTTRRTTLNHLNALELVDMARSLELGARTRVWWPAPAPEERSRASGPDSDAPDHAGAQAAESAVSREPAPERDLEDAVDDAIAALDVPGRPAAVEETRREALRWAWAYLREEERVKPREIADATFEEWHERGIDYSASSVRFDGYQLWDSYLREALRELPGVVPEGQHWRFVEPDE